MSDPEWERIDQIWLKHIVDGVTYALDAMVEAKGEARRAMVRPRRGVRERIPVARWRVDVPASVRVIGPWMSADHKAQFERQLLAYVAGTDTLQVTEPVLDMREPESIAEDLR